jgi:hypothetical protein
LDLPYLDSWRVEQVRREGLGGKREGEDRPVQRRELVGVHQAGEVEWQIGNAWPATDACCAGLWSTWKYSNSIE